VSLVLTPVKGLPLIQTGDDLPSLLITAIGTNQLAILENDILVITQKILSKSEGRFVNLADVTPSAKAVELSMITGKDPCLIEVILSESVEVLRAVPGTLITRHQLGFICANAGVDHSNIENGASHVLLLPKDPSASAEHIRIAIQAKFGISIGVLVIDSHGRAWRNGSIGMAIGGAGVPMLSDQRGWKDLYGADLRVTQVAVADELAAAASLVMGQSSEGYPVVHVRGFPYPLIDQPFTALIRDRSKDLFL